MLKLAANELTTKLGKKTIFEMREMQRMVEGANNGSFSGYLAHKNPTAETSAILTMAAKEVNMTSTIPISPQRCRSVRLGFIPQQKNK